jgi:hypothetical protein
VALRLLRSFVRAHGARAAALFEGPLRRLAGDTAVSGNGELFVRNES